MSREQEEKFNEMTKYDNNIEKRAQPLYEAVKNSILNLQHSILIGPPGTGKTRMILMLIDAIKDQLGHMETLQFHPQYSYQEFVEGHSVNKGVFDYKEGALLRFVDKCVDDKINIMFIDEINRADIGSVFGELLFLLDNDSLDRKVTLPLSNKPFSLPPNLVIVGTMNSADKNIALMDFAIRRRFRFHFIPPDYIGLKEWLLTVGFDMDDLSVDDYIKAVRVLNRRIVKHPLLGKNMTLGQSLFVPKVKGNKSIKISDLVEVFNLGVIPQIESYLGHGNTKDLGILLSPEIRLALEFGVQVSEIDIINLIKVLSMSRELEEA